MSNRWSASGAIALLIVMLGIAAALAYEAQNAVRSHRTTTEHVLRDYAAFAAWEFSRVATRDLTSTFEGVLGDASASCRESAPPDLATFKAKGG